MDGTGKLFVYILRSASDPTRHYVGLTSDVARRLVWHNGPGGGHTVSGRPWAVVVAIEFKRHPSAMGAADVSAFLTWLVVERHVSASTHNQALAGLLFLYNDVLHVEIGSVPPVVRARTPDRLPAP